MVARLHYSTPDSYSDQQPTREKLCESLNFQYNLTGHEIDASYASRIHASRSKRGLIFARDGAIERDGVIRRFWHDRVMGQLYPIGGVIARFL